MTPSLPDDLAARVRRLPAPQQQQALAYVTALERATQTPLLLALMGTIPPDELEAMSAAIETGCERVDASEW